jgi:hypothetical protein
VTPGRALTVLCGCLLLAGGILVGRLGGLQPPVSRAPTLRPATLQVPLTSPLSASGSPLEMAAPPVRLQVARIGVDAPIGPVGLNPDSTIQTPTSPIATGWLSAGPAPGDAGPAVILGHLDSDRGPAVFWRLSQLRPSDAVTVTRSDGSRVDFIVTRVARFSRTTFPNAEVYGATVGPELRLITCGGWFNLGTRQYSENLVVFASLA